MYLLNAKALGYFKICYLVKLSNRSTRIRTPLLPQSRFLPQPTPPNLPGVPFPSWVLWQLSWESP